MADIRAARRPTLIGKRDQNTILEMDENDISKTPSAHAREKATVNGNARDNSRTEPKLNREVSKTTVNSFGMGSKKASLYLSRTKSLLKTPPTSSEGKRTPQSVQNGERTSSRSSENSRPSTDSKATPVLPVQREFTFTGYDIMNDTEPLEPDVEDEREREKRANVQSYIAACRLLGITPVTHIARHINDAHFVMKSHPLGRAGMRAVCIALVDNRRVKSLNLEDNDIGSEGAVCLAELLQKNVSIKEICIGENRIGTIGVRALSEILRTREIHTLDLSGSNLEDDDAQHIADIMESNRHLRSLNVSYNQLSDSAGFLIGRALANNDTLYALNLSWNHLRGKGAMAVAMGLQKNVCLKRLILSWNGFAADGCAQLGKALMENRTLVELDIASNRMGIDAVKGLLPGLQANETLTILRAGQNPFSPEVALAILQGVGDSERSAIHTLDLADTVVDDDFVKAWTEIKKKKSLRVLFGATVKGNEVPKRDPQAIDWRDPVQRMFNYMQEQGYRVVDLLKRLDKDRSLSVDREEFKQGLMALQFDKPEAEKIPLTEAQLDEIVTRLDTDGDGEVDMGELMAGEKEFRKKMHARMRRMMKQSMPADKVGASIKAMLRIDD